MVAQVRAVFLGAKLGTTVSRWIELEISFEPPLGCRRRCQPSSQLLVGCAELRTTGAVFVVFEVSAVFPSSTGAQRRQVIRGLTRAFPVSLHSYR